MNSNAGLSCRVSQRLGSRSEDTISGGQSAMNGNSLGSVHYRSLLT